MHTHTHTHLHTYTQTHTYTHDIASLIPTYVLRRTCVSMLPPWLKVTAEGLPVTSAVVTHHVIR